MPEAKPTEQSPIDRRKETRYPIEAQVIVHKRNGESLSAAATNISSSGMLLKVAFPAQFVVDELVSVEVELPDEPGAAFSSWGIGRVARIDGHGCGIQLFAGTYEEGVWSCY